MIEANNFIINSATAIVLLPLWVIIMIVANATIPSIASKKLTLNLSLGSIITNIFFSIFWVIHCIKNPQTQVENIFPWLNTEQIQISLGTLIDNVSASIILVSNIILFCVLIYAYGEIKNNKNFHKIFIYLNILNFSISAFSLSPNAIQSFLFGEIISLSLYLLISSYHNQLLSTKAAQKALVYNKIGDLFFLGGILVLIYHSITFATPQNIELLSYSTLNFNAENIYSMVSANTYTIITILLLTSILVKCAQIPFQNWISKTTETPTTIIAIIQGLIPLVSTGIIMTRFYPLFILSEQTMQILYISGIISALVFSYVALSQNNLKKLITYSTISQLGLIITGFGLNAYSESIFSLFTHALSKTLLILTAGTIIYAMNNENNIKYFGGLRHKMPIPATAFLFSCISLSGILFSGFYSQSSLISKIFENNNNYLTLLFLFTLFLNSFALFRAYFLIFEEKPRFEFTIKNPSKCTLFPILILILCTIFFGQITFKHINNYIYFINPEIHTNIIPWTIIVSEFIILCGAYIAFKIYVSPFSPFMITKETFLNKNNMIYKLSFNALYLSEICSWINNKIIIQFYKLINFVEKYIINTIAAIFDLSTRIISYIFSKIQNGNIQNYIFYSAIIITIIITIITTKYVLEGLMRI